MKILFASCLLLLCSTIQPNTVVHSVFRSGYATEDVVLDTNPGSAFWQGAPSHAPETIGLLELVKDKSK